jgi:hypothetical protein
MIKLYRRTGDTLRYHEAWADDEAIIEHWGVVGEAGERREHPFPDGDEDDAIDEILRPALEDGFAPINPADQVGVVIEYGGEAMGILGEPERRNELEDRLDEALGWTGLGMCDGFVLDAGGLKMYCYVVDFDLARRAIDSELAGSEFADYTRIYREDAN